MSASPGRWLSIVGLGEDGLDALSPATRALIAAAEVLIGGERHLAMVPESDCERLTWTSPLRLLLDEIGSRRGRRVCILATGDPFCYGIGVSLARSVPCEEMTVIPAESAFTLACARLGWSHAEVETLTLHGRPLELVNAVIYPGARLIVLSEDRGTPMGVAEILRARGYGQSRLIALEHMGGERENRVEGTAAAWGRRETADFHTLAIECVAEDDAICWPRVPGLPDDAFEHDGQLTKREVRATTLAALGPLPGRLLWDVGAGSGSVAIEWMRVHATMRAVAVERDAGRAVTIASNAAALGAPRLAVVHDTAPGALEGLEAPDAVFVGGGVATPGLLDRCWEALKPRGRLVSNAVTLEGEQALSAFVGSHDGHLTRIAVSRAEGFGRFTGWRPLAPVTQLLVTKAS